MRLYDRFMNENRKVATGMGPASRLQSSVFIPESLVSSLQSIYALRHFHRKRVQVLSPGGDWERNAARRFAELVAPEAGAAGP